MVAVATMKNPHVSLLATVVLVGSATLECGVSSSADPESGCVERNPLLTHAGPNGGCVERAPLSIACPVLGGSALPGLAAPTDTAQSVLVNVGQSTRGPQTRYGASVFNVVAREAERCAQVAVGACVVRDCRPPPARIGDMGAALTGRNLGRVAVRDSITPATDAVALMPQTNSTYARPEGGAGARWRADDEICVNALGGGEMGPFQVPVRFPEPLRYVGPTVPDAINEIVYIDRRTPLELRWEPTAERVVATLGQRAANGTAPDWLEEITVSCAFDGAAGVGSIPPSILGRFLSAAEGNSSGGLTVVSQRQSRVLVAGTQVQVNASAGLSLRAEYR